MHKELQNTVFLKGGAL